MTRRFATRASVAILSIVLLAASFAYYYTTTENQVSILNSQVSTLNGQISTLKVQLSSLSSVQTNLARVVIVNGSVPASAWQNLSSGTVTHVQCGQTQPPGSGFLTLNNTGNGPTTVGIVIVYVNGTKYVAEASLNTQSCTIDPSASLTVYFTFSGSTLTKGEEFDLYYGLGNGFESILGGIS